MKQAEGAEELAQRFGYWTHDYSRAELEALQPELASWLARERVDLRQLLTSQADETLALAVQKGFFEASAFTELFRNRYEGRLLAWFDRWGTEPNTAFDLVQELFAKFHAQGLESYNPSRPLRCYLRTTAFNLWVTRVCRDRRPVLADNLDTRQGSTSVMDELERREAEERLGGALAQLPDDLRAVMELHLEGYSPAEVAQRLGTTVKRFYGRLHRARRRLARALGIDLPPSNRGRKPKQDRTRPKDSDS